MSATSAERHSTVSRADHSQPCGLDCAHAQPLRSDPFGEEWLWCTHPANAVHLIRPGRPCTRYVPASDPVAVLQAGAPRRAR